MGGSGSVAVQGLVALDDRPLSPRQRYAAILVALGEFIDGYDLIVMGGALILLRPQFGLSPSQVGLLGASTFLGAMVGMLIFGDMSDRWGRRAIFVANLIFFVVFSIISAFVQSVPELFVARFLVGVGVGMDVPTSAAYLAEIAPRHRRGVVAGSLLNITWILGAMASTLIALPLIAWTGEAAWRWMFGLAAVPALLVLTRSAGAAGIAALAARRTAAPRKRGRRWPASASRPTPPRWRCHPAAGSGRGTVRAGVAEACLAHRTGVLPELRFRPAFHHRRAVCAAHRGGAVAGGQSGLQRTGVADWAGRGVLRIVSDRPYRPAALAAGRGDPGRIGGAVHGIRRTEPFRRC